MNNDDDDDDDNTSNASNTIENVIRLSGDEDEDENLTRDASTHSISLVLVYHKMTNEHVYFTNWLLIKVSIVHNAILELGMHKVKV